MSDEKLTLQAGIAYMERCLDAELSSQRAVAHSAIDMDDWDKAQEILAKSKEAISRVEVLRGKFAEFKKFALGNAPAEPVSAHSTSNSAHSTSTSAPNAAPAANAAPSAPAASEKVAAPAPAPAANTAHNANAAPTAPAAPEKAANPAPAKETAKGEFSFAAAIEELIEKHPYAMAVCNAAPNMNNIFTYDDIIAKQDMKKAVQLSNGMWAETAIPEDKARLITDALRKYCESRKQG